MLRVSVSEFGGSGPSGVPVQVTPADPPCVGAGDTEAARAPVAEDDEAGRFLDSGDQHLFPDCSLPAVAEAAAQLHRARVLTFLDAG